MKLVTFVDTTGRQRIGALMKDGTSIAVLQAGEEVMAGGVSPYFAEMLSFLRGGMPALTRAKEVMAYIEQHRPKEAMTTLETVNLMAPVPVPESIRDAMCFEEHIVNIIRVVGLKKLAFLDEWIEKLFGRKRSLAYLLNKTWYERPIYYKGNRRSTVGTNADVRMPVYAKDLDFELEFGIYIGKEGVNIAREDAHEYIGGYTIFNDFSVRDIQLKEQGGRLGPAKGKDFDTGNAFGPFLVTPDEIQDPQTLTMVARVNGAEWSRGSSADMHWKFADLIAYISQSETLYPGDFIGSGTCSGVNGRGCGLEMGKSLNSGDVIELEVQGLGILRNKIV
jgi:2-keto-4-pentenoate hydratase/2-oxohepta-3-ene-1,7-dioic acid hydratase in catechol pathway